MYLFHCQHPFFTPFELATTQRVEYVRGAGNGFSIFLLYFFTSKVLHFYFAINNRIADAIANNLRAVFQNMTK